MPVVREAVGPDIGLTADANSAYTLADADDDGTRKEWCTHRASGRESA